MRFSFFSSFAVVASLALGCGGAAEDSSTVSPSPGPSVAQEQPSQKQRPAPSQPSRATWCDSAGTHDFCADFDGEDPLEEWDHATRGNDRNQKDVDAITSSERSAPNALRITGGQITEEGKSSSASYLWSGMFLVKKLPTTTSSKATLAFDVYVSSKFANVVQLAGRTSTDDIAFNVTLDIGDDATWLASALGEIPKQPPIAKNRWVRVEISIDDNGGTGGVAALAFDGENAGTTTFEGSLAASAETTLYLGVSRSAPSEAYEVRYDNVVVDLH